jgi:hypothetical protein
MGRCIGIHPGFCCIRHPSLSLECVGGRACGNDCNPMITANLMIAAPTLDFKVITVYQSICHLRSSEHFDSSDSVYIFSRASGFLGAFGR